LTGIHGLPTNNWDDVGKRFNDSNNGYCAHGVLIFPTWHRPYLSLVEVSVVHTMNLSASTLTLTQQTIYLQMVEIAGRYDGPHRQKYLDAAKTFRLPYLDYFRPRDGKVEFPGLGQNASKTTFPYNFRLPDILNEKKIALRLPPNNELAYDIDNPLYTYKFSEANGQLPKSNQDFIVSYPSTAALPSHIFDRHGKDTRLLKQ
jgi:tyrosinase